MLSHSDKVMSSKAEIDMAREVEGDPASFDAIKYFVLLPFITKKLS